ncbi:MAG TPA: pyridoxal-dependent decarboxylase, partial [Steroidobacteraceae bacterium]|nr:pyridoxal-dependent decarboxylase [Steroidobacteraceae bacterium]
MPADRIAPPVAALFPERAARERTDDHLTRALADAAERVLRGPVMPDIDMTELRRDLAGFDFSQPRPLDELIDWAIGRLEHGTVHMMHPRYFGLFNPPSNFPSQCADRISGAFNPQLASSGSSPAPVAIEQHVIRAFAQRAGLPAESAGHFTTNGSEANYEALVCALTHADPRFADEGVRAFHGPAVMYTSRECQPAWHKIVHQAGVGRAGLKLIATDGAGRMDVRALADAVREDRRRGRVPVLISATAGTTGAGMVDPLEPCATLARENNIWYHVDAAWGGAALC